MLGSFGPSGLGVIVMVEVVAAKLYSLIFDISLSSSHSLTFIQKGAKLECYFLATLPNHKRIKIRVIESG